MRMRTKVVAAAAALTLAGGMLAALPAEAGASGVTVDITCHGDDDVLAGSLAGAPVPSQQILDILGQLSDPPIEPPNYLHVQVVVTPDVPASLEPGESGDAAFTWSLVLPDSLIEQAKAIGITEITVSNLNLPIEVVGAASGGPIVGTPPDQVIDLTVDPVVPPVVGPFSGSVTAGSTDILYNVANGPEFVQFGTTVAVPGIGTVIFGASCTVDTPPAQVADTFVSGITPTTEGTTTTTAATSTTAAGNAGTSRPRFTG